MERRAFVQIIGFGSVLINTMPVWIGDLASQVGLRDVLAGAFGSLVLLSAALACIWLRHARYLALARIAVPLCLILLAITPTSAWGLPALACCGLGTAVGALSGSRPLPV